MQRGGVIRYCFSVKTLLKYNFTELLLGLDNKVLMGIINTP